MPTLEESQQSDLPQAPHLSMCRLRRLRTLKEPLKKLSPMLLLELNRCNRRDNTRHGMASEFSITMRNC